MYAGMLILFVGGQFGLRGRDFFGIELMGDAERDVRRLLRRAALFVFTLEAVTFLLLLPWSLTKWDPAPAVWRAFFHALSASNCAGFDLMGGGRGFSGQVDEPYPILVMGTAAFLGSISFITVFNLRTYARGAGRSTLRLVVIGMVAMQLMAMLVFATLELRPGNPLSGLNPFEALANIYFLAANRTTGMSTVEIVALEDASVAILLPLMFIGGASTSTASGIKIGTFMVSLVVILSALRGRHSAQVFGREIPQAIVLRATAVTLLGVFLLAGGLSLALLFEDGPFLPLLFEVMSGLANVGWSMGSTGNLSTPGVILITALMFIGRLGPLIVAISIPDRSQERYRYTYGRVRIG